MPKVTTNHLETKLTEQAEEQLIEDVKKVIGSVRDFLRKYELLFDKLDDYELKDERADYVLDYLQAWIIKRSLPMAVENHIKAFMAEVQQFKSQLDSLQDEIDNKRY